jgi:hypothetical protein
MPPDLRAARIRLAAKGSAATTATETGAGCTVVVGWGATGVVAIGL